MIANRFTECWVVVSIKQLTLRIDKNDDSHQNKLNLADQLVCPRSLVVL